jgi:hypothetical protein
MISEGIGENRLITEQGFQRPFGQRNHELNFKHPEKRYTYADADQDDFKPTEFGHRPHETADEQSGGDIDADELGDQYIENSRYQHVKHHLETVPRNEEFMIAVFAEKHPEKNNNA